MTKETFEIKIKSIRPQLVRFAVSLLNNEDEAEDVVQDVCFKLWFIKDSLGSYHSFESIAFVMVKRFIFNLRRDKKEFVTLSSSIENRQELILEHDLSDETLKALESLPNVEQAVMRLKHLEGFENEEIAAMMGSSAGAVRTALSRARKKLRDKYLLRK